MPYVIVDPDKVSSYERLSSAQSFSCSSCDCKDFIPDMFNPYYTIPTAEGWYTEYILMKCAYCGKIHRMTFSRNANSETCPPTSHFTGDDEDVLPDIPF